MPRHVAHASNAQSAKGACALASCYLCVESMRRALAASTAAAVAATWRGVHRLASPPPLLKDELRRLFKLVHPDLFHACPEQQAINQRSFQLLQEYLRALEGSTPAEALYKFEFYVRRDHDPNAGKVELCLPPPQVRHHPQLGPELLPATRSALSGFLSAFGLSPHFSYKQAQQQGKQEEEVEGLRLSEFLQRASELQRQNESSPAGSDRRLITLRNALRVGRGVTATFRFRGGMVDQAKQVEALEALARALDESPDVPLAGCTFVMAERGYCGIDGVGNLWLDLGQGARDWSVFLSQLDVTSVALKRSADCKRRLEELKLAKLMEVEMVLADEQLGVRPEYAAFLQRMSAYAAEEGAVGDGKFYGLPVRIVQPEIVTQSVDTSMGCIVVAHTLLPASIYDLIYARGAEALRVRDEFKWQEHRSSELNRMVRTQLGLRNLMLDEQRVLPEQAEAACIRLVKHAPLLRPLMEGLSLCISDRQRLAPRVAHLGWDFSLSDL